jgi:SAM-dependent methyltransferase
MKDIPGDDGGNFSDLASAKAYIAGNTQTNPEYHADRIRALAVLFKKIPVPKRIVDFGVGDGMYMTELVDPLSVEKVIGIDRSKYMLELCSDRLKAFSFRGVLGSVDLLSQIDGQFDLGLAINVLGYLDTDELDIFYYEMARLIRPGGHLIVLNGNELFDMFALNQGTVEFFKKNFESDVSGLLTEGDSRRPQNATRKNPLNYSAEVEPYGFMEIAQAYSQWHKILPAMGNRGADLAEARLIMRDHNFDPNTLPATERWKAMFRSSIVASLCKRI